LSRAAISSSTKPREAAALGRATRPAGEATSRRRGCAAARTNPCPSSLGCFATALTGWAEPGESRSPATLLAITFDTLKPHRSAGQKS
jgi:hypothetical protein